MEVASEVPAVGGPEVAPGAPGAPGATSNKGDDEGGPDSNGVDPEEGREEKEAGISRELEEAKEKEIALVQEYIDEVKRKSAWKADLRATNAAAAENRPDESEFRKLDSSLKKNTAFIRKLKNFTVAQAEALKREMSGLNLTKYVGEVASALVEAKLKMTDVPSAVETCSVLHQRYAEFASHLLEAWQKILGFKKDDKVSNPSKMRIDLRFYADLISVGVFTLKDGLPLLGQVLTFLVSSDKEAHTLVALILAFCKHCGDDYAGLLPRRIRDPADRHRYQVPESSLLTPEKRKNVVALLREYYNSLCRHLQAENRELQNVERTNKRILLTKGEVHTERKEKAEALHANCAKLLSNVEQLSDALDEPMPSLEDPKKEDADEDEEAELAEKTDAETSLLGDLWEDEETKSFYENLVNLKAFIPAILYKDSSQQGGDRKADKEKKSADPKGSAGPSAEEAARAAEAELLGDDFEAELAISLEEAMATEVAPPSLEDDTEESDSQSASAKMLLDAYLSKLPTSVSREMIDNAAVDFCMNLNTKINRKKLIKALFSVHRNRKDLLPFYARLAATLDPCMPEVPQGLAHYLKQEFRWQVRKKDQMKVESKLKVCHFIGEMVKFGTFAKGEALFCLKMLLFDFSHHNIEMACALMEACGRFLYRSKDSHQRTKIYLEQMMRKKTAMSLDARYTMMIENAFYVVNPPEAPSIPRERLPPMHEYIQRLLYHDLSKTTTEKVLKQIRKLDWKDGDTAEFASASLAAVWNFKYYNIRYAASLMAGLVTYYEWLGPRVVDSVLEDVRLHMETNDVKYNQRRIAVVKFLSELYNYRLVDSSVIFKVLYSLVSFGAATKVDDPVSLALDPPHHMLRIRLVCVMLDTCGIYFNTGGSKKKLDYFLVYFQRYYWRKRTSAFWSAEDADPAMETSEETSATWEEGRRKEELRSRFPIAVENLFTETLATLRPKMKLLKSLEDAEEAAERVDKEMMKSVEEKAPHLAVLFQKEDHPADRPVGGGLGAIAEEGEEEDDDLVPDGEEEDLVDVDEDVEVEDEEAEEEEEEEAVAGGPDSSQRSASRSASALDHDGDELSQEELSQNEELSQDTEGEEEEEEEEEDQSGARLDGRGSPAGPAAAPKHVKCEEDDDFLAAFDKILNDSAAESRAVGVVPRGQQVNIVAPASVHRHKKASVAGNFDPLPQATVEKEEEKSVQFSVLLRKGNKQTYRDLAVPADSDLALNLQRQEEADRREKERVKQLTLEINERQEEEDLNEAIAALQRPSLVPVNRSSVGRGGHHAHTRGAPDADAIFGTRRVGR